MGRGLLGRLARGVAGATALAQLLAHVALRFGALLGRVAPRFADLFGAFAPRFGDVFAGFRAVLGPVASERDRQRTGRC